MFAKIVIVIPALTVVGKDICIISLKLLVSSLLRTQFSGRIMILRNSGEPIFKIARSAVEEIYIEHSVYNVDSINHVVRRVIRQLVSELQGSGDWLMMIECGSLIMRNIDHLIPREISPSLGQCEVDFYWTCFDVGPRKRLGIGVSSGIWAVRTRVLQEMLDSWELSDRTADTIRENTASEDCCRWNSFVEGITLKKTRFESGEIYSPYSCEIEWHVVSHSAAITLPTWPLEDRFSLLQALYLARFIGDSSGLIINLIDP